MEPLKMEITPALHPPPSLPPRGEPEAPAPCGRGKKE